MHRGWVVVLSVICTLVILGLTVFSALSQLNLSALNDPGSLETKWATGAKRWYVSRAIRGPLPTQRADDKTSQFAGSMFFTDKCATCHGMDARTPTEIGRWMYPRALDLGSPEVQQWSDAEMFWIIKNGVRLSGMPAFGKIYSDEQIWNLVHYVRSRGTPRG